MVYIVGYVESGHPRHRWTYNDYPDAIFQLKSLLSVFDEVNSIQPYLLKVSSQESTLSVDTLLKTYSFV